MKKILSLAALLITATSCVIIRFPDTMNVDVTVPENFQKEDIEVIIDTLKSNKVEGIIQVNMRKKSEDQ
jgi:hypothetical protein